MLSALSTEFWGCDVFRGVSKAQVEHFYENELRKPEGEDRGQKDQRTKGPPDLEGIVKRKGCWQETGFPSDGPE